MQDERTNTNRTATQQDSAHAKSERERTAHPTSHDDEQRAVAPEDESREQLSRTETRNRELLDGAEATTEGESSIAGVHTEGSAPPRSGDYAND